MNCNFSIIHNKIYLENAFPILAEHLFMLTRFKNSMSITTINDFRKSRIKQMHQDKVQIRNETDANIDLEQQLTVSTIIKTMLEIIKVKKNPSMDEETRKRFPMIAKEIILLAEQTQ